MNHITLPHRSLTSAIKTSSVAASIGLVGGIGLQFVTKDIVLLVPLLIALPAINAMAGDFATIITAHIGDPEASQQTINKLLKAMVASVPVSAAGVVAVSLFIATLQGYEVTRSFMYLYSWFVFMSFTVVVAVTVLSSIVLNKILVDKKMNSDDVLIPISNVLASVLMLLCIALAAWRLF